MNAIEKTLILCKKHLSSKGILILDLPNHKVEIKNSGQQYIESYKLKDKQIDIVFRDYKEKNKWVSHWEGYVRLKNKYKRFTEHYEELIIDVVQFEKKLKKYFIILNLYGSRTGGKLGKNSYRRFYVCKLK